MDHTAQLAFTKLDSALQKEFLRNLKVRSIEQKFLYFSDGATRYYDYIETIDPEMRPEATLMDGQLIRNVIKSVVKKDEKVAFVALTCGNGWKEKKMFEPMYQEGYNFTVMGVDSSPEMIALAKKQFEGSEFPYDFWTADITTYQFCEEVREKTKGYDRVIFSFLGKTIGNMIQTEIIDTLYNLMEPGHLLWFDCVTRDMNDKAQDLRLFQNYAKIIKNESCMNFLLYPMDAAGIPRDAGVPVLEILFEESIGVIRFCISFQFKEPCTITFMDEYVHFLPPEKIKLVDVRAYHPDTMIKYIEQHQFSLVACAKENGEFIFGKGDFKPA